MKRFLLLLLLASALSACTTAQGFEEEQPLAWWEQPQTEEFVQELYKRSEIKEYQDGDNWVREWVVDGRQLAIEFTDINYYLENKEEIDERKPYN